MIEVKVVIGANFGDEGKGLMTDYFAKLALEKKYKCVVVRHNGGAQAGHTVYNNTHDTSFIFHHIGSGTFRNADTYLSEEFIVNPIVFVEDINKLHLLGFHPTVIVHPKCIVTTPFDMLINQCVELNRNTNKHGSCGAGIFETIKRNETEQFTLTVEDCVRYHNTLKEKLMEIRDIYFPQRLQELGVKDIPANLQNVLVSEELITHFLSDVDMFLDNIKIEKDNVLLPYDSVIFEGAQGLLLDQSNSEYFPHLTPSNTGLKNPTKILTKLGILQDKTIYKEVCYVSRSYLTRHGAGKFPTEIISEDSTIDNIHNFNQIYKTSVSDSTNKPNGWQDSLRIGYLDMFLHGGLIERVANDYCPTDGIFRLSLSITHLDQTNGYYIEQDKCSSLNILVGLGFLLIYGCYSPKGEDVEVLFDVFNNIRKELK